YAKLYVACCLFSVKLFLYTSYFPVLQLSSQRAVLMIRFPYNIHSPLSLLPPISQCQKDRLSGHNHFGTSHTHLPPTCGTSHTHLPPTCGTSHTHLPPTCGTSHTHLPPTCGTSRTHLPPPCGTSHTHLPPTCGPSHTHLPPTCATGRG